MDGAKGNAGFGSHVDDVHHVRVMDPRGGLAFAQEPRLRLRYARHRRPQRLDREPLLEAQVHGLVDHTHPPAPELLYDAIVRDGATYHLGRILLG